VHTVGFSLKDGNRFHLSISFGRKTGQEPCNMIFG